MPTGGQNNYPSLMEIANLVRSFVNDDKRGATGTPGEGQILVNSGVTLPNFMNSAIREFYREIRIMGQPTLIKDNYILYGLTPVNSPLGVGVANPAVQVSLQFVGYFDGLGFNPNLALPADLILPMELWQRQSINAPSMNPFGPVNQATGALQPRMQNIWLGEWEWRTDGLWMNGATQLIDIRLRYIATYVDLAQPTPTIDWTNTFVPVMDSQEAIADLISVRYARRLGGDTLADAEAQAKSSVFKYRQQVVRDRQLIDYTRPIYGQGRAGSAGDASRYLY